MNRIELKKPSSSVSMTGSLSLVDARLIRRLQQLRAQFERLEAAPTRAMLTPVVCLDALRYQLSQLRCVDAVSFPSETSDEQRLVHFPDVAAGWMPRPVSDNDPRPVTLTIEEIAADRPHPLVLVTGCFDLIHAAHMGLIEIAAELGARPVVAALTTKGIRAQPKNVDGHRPFWAMADRLTVLSELRSNPRVLFFEGPDCLELIERLRPDIFVKEQRDRSREIVQREARLVEQLGGRVVWVQNDRFGDLSSTAIAKALSETRQELSEVSHGH